MRLTVDNTEMKPEPTAALSLRPRSDGAVMVIASVDGSEQWLLTFNVDGTLTRHFGIPSSTGFALDDDGCLALR